MNRRGLRGVGCVAFALVLAAFAVTAAPEVQAHAFAPSLLELRELASGRVAVRWKQPAKRLVGTELRPVLPESCSPVGDADSYREGTGVVVEWEVECSDGLVGQAIRIEGLSSSRTSVVLRLVLDEDRSIRRVLNAGKSRFVIPERERVLDVARSYTELGVEHILTGFDHLLFVLALVLLVGRGKMLLWTVTAFTVGHSVTLALAILEWIILPQAPIEIAIAFSIYVLAIEIVRKEQGKATMVNRAPWVVAGLFGLLHGLGFAGALAEVGLPNQEIPLALFSFNVGIEVGQLLFVALVLLAWALLRAAPIRWPAKIIDVPTYAIGGMAAFWVFERTWALFERF
ncbi:MAG: HupE/UreJ family protein [Myxococcota bacterium]